MKTFVIDSDDNISAFAAGEETPLGSLPSDSGGGQR